MLRDRHELQMGKPHVFDIRDQVEGQFFIGEPPHTFLRHPSAKILNAPHKWTEVRLRDPDFDGLASMRGPSIRTWRDLVQLKPSLVGIPLQRHTDQLSKMGEQHLWNESRIYRLSSPEGPE